VNKPENSCGVYAILCARGHVSVPANSSSGTSASSNSWTRIFSSCLCRQLCKAFLFTLPAQILVQLLEDAERFTGREVRKAIISVPAYFNAKQREATANAGTCVVWFGAYICACVC